MLRIRRIGGSCRWRRRRDVVIIMLYILLSNAHVIFCGRVAWWCGFCKLTRHAVHKYLSSRSRDGVWAASESSLLLLVTFKSVYNVFYVIIIILLVIQGQKTLSSSNHITWRRPLSVPRPIILIQSASVAEEVKWKYWERVHCKGGSSYAIDRMIVLYG